MASPADSPDPRVPTRWGLLGRRLAARALDLAVVGMILWVLGLLGVTVWIGELADRFAPGPWGRALVPLLVAVVLQGVGEIVYTSRNEGQTPAKDVLHLRVVTVDGGAVPTGRRAALRWLLPGAALLVPPAGLGAVVALAALGVPALVDGRAAHDRLAGTRVVWWDRDAEQGPAPATGRARDERLGLFDLVTRGWPRRGGHR